MFLPALLLDIMRDDLKGAWSKVFNAPACFPLTPNAQLMRPAGASLVAACRPSRCKLCEERETGENARPRRRATASSQV